MPLTLEEILRCKPELWTQIHTWLKEEGRKGNLERNIEETYAKCANMSNVRMKKETPP